MWNNACHGVSEASHKWLYVLLSTYTAQKSRKSDKTNLIWASQQNPAGQTLCFWNTLSGVWSARLSNVCRGCFIFLPRNSTMLVTTQPPQPIRATLEVRHAIMHFKIQDVNLSHEYNSNGMGMKGVSLSCYTEIICVQSSNGRCLMLCEAGHAKQDFRKSTSIRVIFQNKTPYADFWLGIFCIQTNWNNLTNDLTK